MYSWEISREGRQNEMVERVMGAGGGEGGGRWIMEEGLNGVRGRRAGWRREYREG